MSSMQLILNTINNDHLNKQNITFSERLLRLLADSAVAKLGSSLRYQ